MYFCYCKHGCVVQLVIKENDDDVMIVDDDAAVKRAQHRVYSDFCSH